VSGSVPVSSGPPCLTSARSRALEQAGSRRAALSSVPLRDGADRDQFKTAMNARLKVLGTSHVGFFHDSRSRAAGRVGTKTPGRLVATSGFKVGFGYRVALPVAAYYTWKGTNLEGPGVAPDVDEPLCGDALGRGDDNQLRHAQAEGARDVPVET
jgi:hypothetical protein